ncbi:MAG: zinc ribbon domain-containing protein [Desulfobulbaceae bacterium]|nr:zinc ribbon domain-containing protein [Desulfobulbaceae bacterium]
MLALTSESCLKYLDEEHSCPYCNSKLSCCTAPPIHVGDGLGWGSEIIFICLNDECKLFVNGWKQAEEQYGHVASFRYMMTPGAKSGTPMTVYSKDAFTDSIIDPEDIKAKDKRLTREKDALAKLDTCVKEKNLEPVLYLITDEKATPEGRLQACELLEQINDLVCIDPIRNHTFKHNNIERRCNLAINNIFKAHHKKECPYCAEIIKAQAKLCKHCGKEV